MLGRAVLAALAVSLAVACSAIVAPEDIPIRCTESDACPKGFVCEDELCVPDTIQPPPDGGGCVPNDEPELCNGIDDDCDGTIDEGHDADGDDVTWCNGGQASGRDCNDQDPDETPGKPEVCDGHDNDCNGETDDGVCPDGLTCEPSSGECITVDCRRNGCEPGYICEETGGAFTCMPGDIPQDCRDGTLTCGPDEFCNQQDGSCAPGGALGATCNADSQCRDDMCAAPASLGMAGVDWFCAKECCSTADCPAGFVCWQPGTGWSACVARSALGLGDGAAAAGTGCASDSDCASGSCVADTCAEPCCDDGDCSGGECTVVVDEGASDVVKMVCGSGGVLGAGFPCGEDGDCASLFCAGFGYCTAGCCSSAACGVGMICGAATIETDSGSAIQPLCVEALGWLGDPLYGDQAAGTDCTDNSDCRSNYCLDDVCVDNCCSDADCPANTSCRLHPVRDGGELLCMRNR